MTFSGLTIGDQYRISGQVMIESSVTGGVSAEMTQSDTTTVIWKVSYNGVSADDLGQITTFPQGIFTATGTTILFEPISEGATEIIKGNYTFEETWLELEALNNYEAETSDYD